MPASNNHEKLGNMKPNSISNNSLSHKIVALIQGGLGAEREISLMSAQAVAKAFKELGVPYTKLFADKHLWKNLSRLKPDKAFLSVHGKYAEDGSLQGLCEYLKIPYTGSGVLASALCMDKCFFKDYIRKHGIPTPQSQNLNLEKQNMKEVEITLPLPFVIKPAREGSTLGISICKKQPEIQPAIKIALQYDKKILVESYIEGIELAVSVLNGKALTPVEIQPASGFYDYSSKYQSKKTKYILPPRLDQKTITKCKEIALKTALISDVKTYCRADFIVQQNTEPLLTEINTLPGLTTHSLLPKSAEYDGISFPKLILKILESASLDYP